MLNFQEAILNSYLYGVTVFIGLSGNFGAILDDVKFTHLILLLD